MARLRINPNYTISPYPTATKWSLSMFVGGTWVLFADLRPISQYSDGFTSGIIYDSYIVLWDADNTMLYSYSGNMYYGTEGNYQWDVVLNELEIVPTPPAGNNHWMPIALLGGVIVLAAGIMLKK